MNYLQLAIRNIVRNRKRSVVTIFIITLGFTALGVIGGILNNIFSRLKEQAIKNEKLGHITLVKQGYFENGKIAKDKYLFSKEELNGLLKIVRADERVSLATPRLGLLGMVSNGDASSIFITEATDAKDDREILKLAIDGRKESLGGVVLSDKEADRNKVAIGEELAKNLKIAKGSTLTLLTNTKEGIANAMDVEVGQVFNTGNPATNDKFVLANLSAMQELYDTEGAEKIVITVKDFSKIGAVQADLQAAAAKAGFKTESKTWDEISLSYGKVKTMFGVIFRVLMIIISGIVLLTLLNTMQMSVSERTREIGALRAIGMLKSTVVKMFSVEGLMLTIFACGLAVPVLLGVKFLLQWLNISFIPPVASISIPVNLIFNPLYIIPVVVLFNVVTLISSFSVAKRIAGQRVVTSLAYTNS